MYVGADQQQQYWWWTDDIIIWTPFCIDPSAQVQQQQQENEPSQ